jgi:hypothetical protein
MRVLQAAFSVARLPITLVEQGLSVAGSAVRLVGRVADRGGDGAQDTPWPPPEPADVAPPVVAPDVDAVVDAAVEAAPPPEPTPVEVPAESGRAAGLEPDPPEPVHVSEEPVLVAEVAEAGAEDGAGAELSVAEPWDGYDAMTAAEIRRRLREADAATAAAVRLYEAANKGRSTVLAAASETTSG